MIFMHMGWIFESVYLLCYKLKIILYANKLYIATVVTFYDSRVENSSHIYKLWEIKLTLFGTTTEYQNIQTIRNNNSVLFRSNINEILNSEFQTKIYNFGYSLIRKL